MDDPQVVGVGEVRHENLARFGRVVQSVHANENSTALAGRIQEVLVYCETHYVLHLCHTINSLQVFCCQCQVICVLRLYT